MNDEIKIKHELNILSNTILDDTTYKPTISRRKLLLDYITNLQEELEEEKRIEEADLHKIQSLEEENEDLKSKLECYENDVYYSSKVDELEQENERLKEQLEYLRSGEYLNQVKWERDLNENLNQTLGTELEDYKTRCEKAIEYVKRFTSYYDECEFDGWANPNDLLNILQNGSDSE